MNNTAINTAELSTALAVVKRCAEGLPLGRRYRVINYCSRIAGEVRKHKPEAPEVSARYAAKPSPAEPPAEGDARSQRSAILALLQEGRVLTKDSAKKLTGAEDYRKRISELRREGYPIADRWQTGTSRYGHACRFKEYYMEGKI